MTPAPSGSSVPARWRIVAWILLTTGLGLTAVVVTVHSTLSAQAAERANGDVVQELDELRTFAAGGVDPTTAAPFTSSRRLLEVHLSRQSPDASEVVLVVAADGTVVEQRSGGAHDVAGSPDVLAAVTDPDAESGMTEVSGAQMRWGRVQVTVDDADPPTAFVIAEFSETSDAYVDGLVRTVGLVCVVAMLFTAGIAVAVAGSILAPVREVTRTAARIGDTDLGRRIVVHGRDDVAELATTFNAMLDRVEVAFAAQREFVDGATHELSRPVAGLRDEIDRLEPESGARLGEQLDRLEGLLEDLRLLSAAGRPDFVERRAADPAPLVRGVVHQARDRWPERAWCLEEDGPTGTVEVDPGRVREALEELAHNAVRHTRPGDVITLGSRVGDGRVVLWVRDPGPGVRAEEAEEIFERFRHGARGPVGGSRAGAGLGLAVVRAVADAHDGAAFVSSEPGRGATFGLDLPVTSAAGTAT